MADNPYMTVASPSYGAPLVNLFDSAQSGMGLGQAARRGVQNLQGLFRNQQAPQWPQQGQQAQGVPYAQTQPGLQPNPQTAPYSLQGPQAGVQSQQQTPQYARNLGQIFGLTPGASPGAQSPTQWTGAPVPYTNFDYPGA